MNQSDKEIVKDLGKRVKEIASLPCQSEKRSMWMSLNKKKPDRPMVLIDQVPWHEMNVDGELTLQCEDRFCREVEARLRRTLYAWKHMPVDMVVEPYLEFPKIIKGLDLGMNVEETKLATDSENDVVSHGYIDQLRDEEDLSKIQAPEIFLDEQTTAEIEEKANDLLGGILEVRMQGCFPAFAAWDRIAEYRGVESILYDLVDRPEFIHKIISRYTDMSLLMLDQLEAKGLLGYGQSLVHCSAVYTDELPAPGFDPASPRAKDLWTFGMAQIFATVSPAMHNEFEMDYALKWYERFGLVYYGCCEPLHNKMDMVRRIPTLRKVSMSPWVDVEKGAEQIGSDYVFVSKPNPAILATNTWEPEAVGKDLRSIMETCARHHCPTEFLLKDISTVGYKPQKLWEWAEVAMRVVGDNT